MNILRIYKFRVKKLDINNKIKIEKSFKENIWRS